MITDNPNIKFSSLDDEEYRTYVWPDNSEVTISLPTHLNVSKSGGHRVLDSNGVSHYVPTGWSHLFWKVKQGKPNFKF